MAVKVSAEQFNERAEREARAVAGRRAFEGEDVSTILAAVIQSESRWDGVPANVRRLLESCLQKDSRRRLRDIGDVWKMLDDAPAAPSRVALNS